MSRKRWIWRQEAAVWCPGGRWGPRQTRVTECSHVLRAEDLYTALLKNDAPRVCAGASGTATFEVEGPALRHLGKSARTPSGGVGAYSCGALAVGRGARASICHLRHCGWPAAAAGD